MLEQIYLIINVGSPISGLPGLKELCVWGGFVTAFQLPHLQSAASNDPTTNDFIATYNRLITAGTMGRHVVHCVELTTLD